MEFSFSRVFPGLLALLIACAHTEREPSGNFESVRAFSRSLDDGAELVMVGIDAPPQGRRLEVGPEEKQRLLQSKNKAELPVALRPADFGFDAPPGTWIVPKYLVSKGARLGPQKVYVFEGRRERMQYSVFGNKREMKVDTFKHSSLPRELVEVGDARGQLFRGALKELALSSLSFPPLIPLNVLWRHKHREVLDWGKYHSTYWERIINEALDRPGTMPDFERHFSRNDLINIGFALAVRFNRATSLNLFGSERWEGILMSEDHSDKIDLFHVYRGLKKNTTERNMGQLVKVANEQGLILIPFGPNIAFLFYDKTNLKPKEHWRALSIHTQSPEEAEALRKKTSVERGNLVPLGIYVLTSSYGTVQLADIHDPLKVGLTSRVFQTYRLGRDLGYSFFLPSVLSTSFRFTEAGVRWAFRKNGKAWFDFEYANYAELEILLDTGMVSFDPEEVVVESFCSDLESFGVSEERSLQLCQELRQSRADPDNLKTFVQGAVREISSSEKRKGRWLFASPSKPESERLLSTMQFMNWLQSERQIRRLAKKVSNRDLKRLNAEKKRALKEAVAESARKQKAASSAHTASDESTRQPSLILFMIDGLAAGELETVARNMKLPNLKSLFVDSGSHFNVYASRTLSMPSWGTLLTGFEADEHGLRSNALVSRKKLKPELLTDARLELLVPKYIAEGRSHRKLMESGISWFPRLLPREEVLVNFMPITDGSYPPVASLLRKFSADYKEVLFGTFEAVNALDAASAAATADMIRKNPGKHRLVMNWYASLDTHTHSSNATKFRSFKVLDSAIGQVLDAARRDPLLSNAVVVLLSDHGFEGGLKASHLHRPFAGGESYLNNTAFNLTKYFAGDYHAQRDLRFVVAAAESPEPLMDFKFIREFMIHPISYTYRGAQKNRGKKNLLVDYSGDRLAQIFLGRGPKESPAARMSLHDLRNFDSTRWGASEPFRVDLPDRLLSQTLENLEISDPAFAAKIKNESGSRPVKFFAMALAGEMARESVDRLLTQNAGSDRSDRAPIVICAHEWKCGVIQTRHRGGLEQMRYSIVRNFQQDEAGIVSGSLSTSAEDDPLDYLGSVLNTQSIAQWRSDREWLRLAEDHAYPTIVFGLVRALTNAPRHSTNVDREAELPDFVLMAARGFNFNSSRLTEGDHGAFGRDEAKITFVVSGLGKSRRPLRHFSDPKLSRDVGATLAEILGERAYFPSHGQALLDFNAD